MTVVRFSRKLFEKEIGKLDESMQERISMFGTPVEAVTDEELEVDVTPNRPDLISYQGFKRNFLALVGKKTGLTNYKINPPEENFKVTIDSSLKTIRPYTACAIVKGLKFDNEKIKEIIEIQEKLHLTVGRKRKKLAIGIYPLEKIKLPIEFKALEPDKIRFIPLESEREMSGLEILQRHPTGRDYAHLLAGKEKFPVFMDSEGKILSMPPIINSQQTGKITEETKDVFIECSGFDFNILKKCLNILVTALADMGGKIYQMEIKGLIKEKTPDLTPEERPISLENTNKLLGLQLTEKQLKELLEKAGYDYTKGKVLIPAWRTDILHEVDLIEDVAIAYGYEKIIPEIPKISTIGSEDPKEIIKRKICEILSGLGFLEVSNYHLTTIQDQFEKMGEKEAKEFIPVENSKTDYNILRCNLKHYLMKNFSENVDTEYPQRIFETGRVFTNKGLIEEKEKLAIAVTPGNFTELKQDVLYLFRMLSKEVEIKETEKPEIGFIEGRTADILIKNKKVGQLGEIHPKILRNWHLKMPIAILEIDLSNIF